MALRKFQPARPDLLINTDWGIPKEQLSPDDAKNRGMKLFHGRWVTKEEKDRLQEEYSTYHSIRMTGGLLIVLAIPLFINIGAISRGGIISTALAVIYGLGMPAAGIGLFRLNRSARDIAVLVFLSFLVLPFLPLLSDDKGSPLIVLVGVIGLYYLLRRTARTIFTPSFSGNADRREPDRSTMTPAQRSDVPGGGACMTTPDTQASLLRQLRGGLIGAVLLVAFDAVYSGSVMASAMVCPVWFLVSLVKAIRKRPGWKVGLSRMVLPLLVLAIVVGNDALQSRIAAANAERIIEACRQFRAVTGKYPDRLAELAPRYLGSIPRAKYAVMSGDFLYLSQDGNHQLMWVKVPPFGRMIYDLEPGKWSYRAD